MPYLSAILNRPVVDLDGEPLGVLDDVVAAHGESPHPQVVALVVKRSGESRAVPFEEVLALTAPSIPLRHRAEEVPTFPTDDSHVLLVRDVLDKQLIDTNGVRVVRVNDIELARIGESFYLANVDIGGLGLLRRLGLSRWAQKVASRRTPEQAPGVISWHDVQLLPGDRVQLRVPSDKINELHPADLATILGDLNRSDSTALLDSLDIKTVADALEEVEPEFQASLLEGMTDDRVADVLEEMAPDEAADLLAELPHDRSEELLNLMEQEEAQDVRRLLAYPEDCAGGIMNTEFVTIRPDLTIAQALAVIRETAHEAETMYYVYIVDSEQHLLGVLSLRELVLAAPDAVLGDLMHSRVVTVALDATQDEVAQAVARYNLLAVPVVDEQGRVQGIVTADDALDKIIPTAWKKRLPRFYH